MSSVNKVILVGRLGKDPEVRYTQVGKAVASFSVATDESYKDRSGQRQKKTEWHNIVVWGPAVENFVQKYLHKGDLVYIEGKNQTRSWEDKKNGGTRYTTEVVVSDIKSLEARPSQTQAGRPAAAPAGSEGRTGFPQDIQDDDILF